MDIELALQHDPLAGDEGRYRKVSDKIVFARKEHICDMCLNKIKVDEPHRARVEIDDGRIGTYRYCKSCCEAMATDIENDYNTDEITKRYLIADENRKLLHGR